MSRDVAAKCHCYQRVVRQTTRRYYSLGGRVVIGITTDVDHIGSLVYADIVDVHVIGLQGMMRVSGDDSMQTFGQTHKVEVFEVDKLEIVGHS